MTVSFWQDSGAWPGELEHRHESADIGIVGGGFQGALLAKLLGEAGRSVIVLEAGTVGSGASGRNVGHIIPTLRTNYHLVVELLGHDQARDLRRAVLASRETVRDYCERYRVPYERSGSQYLGADSTEAAALRDSARALAAIDDEVEYSDDDPFGLRFVGRLVQPGDLAVQPYLLVTRLMADSSALVIENSEVRTIEQRGETVILRSNRAKVECGRAILATNAYSRSLHPYFRDKVFPTRGQCYATAPAPPPRLFPMPTETDNRFSSFRQLPDGRVVVNGHRNRFVDEEVGFGDETTLHLQASVQGWMTERFPELAKLEVTHRWAGIMGFTPDALPLVGRLPDLPNVYFAVGFHGSGMSYGPLVAQRCVEYLLHGTHPGLLHAERASLRPNGQAAPVRMH